MKIRLLQCYVALWIHNIDAICTCLDVRFSVFGLETNFISVFFALLKLIQGGYLCFKNFESTFLFKIYQKNSQKLKFSSTIRMIKGVLSPPLTTVWWTFGLLAMIKCTSFLQLNFLLGKLRNIFGNTKIKGKGPKVRPIGTF